MGTIERDSIMRTVLIAGQLRQIARQLTTSPSALEEYSLWAAAGRLIADASGRGLLQVPGLAEHFSGCDDDAQFANRFLAACGNLFASCDDGMRVTSVRPGLFDGVVEVNPMDPWSDRTISAQRSAILEALADEVETADEADDRAAKGVSLHDAAERIRPGDREGQQELITTWRGLRSPKLPASIGKCPNHKQRNLYKPAAIVRFLKAVEGPTADRDFTLSKHFRQVERAPRQ